VRIQPGQSVHPGIQIAVTIIIRFSVKETKLSGLLLAPPTQARSSSRLSR